MKLLGFWLLGGVIVGGALLWCRPAQAASGWQLVGWGGTRVGAVVVSPLRAQDVATVADGTLELSHDGGVVWLPCTVPARVNVVAYDPVQPGWLYAGSDTGLYVSRDNGLSWQRFESVQTIHKITVALVVDNQYVFASMFDGAGTPVQVFRVSRDGTATVTGFPDGNADCFALEGSRHRIYAGAAGGVYSSDDEGQTWQGGGRGAGNFTNRVALSAGFVWQLSADGLYRSHDGGQSWDRLVGPADLNGTYYGSSMHLSGLAVVGEAAYYGAYTIGFPYQFLAAYSGGSAHSVFDGRVNDVATVGGRIWVATDSGLWVNNNLVGTEAAVRRPVIIIPGILGSLPTREALKTYASAIIEEGHWDHSYKTPLELDPIDHTYNGLIDYLLARGYQRDKTLFVFPYNWMQGADATGRQLAGELVDVRQACGCTQVDLVTHSLGGLIARSYIQSDYYQSDVANLIQLGTPNAGAVKAYRVWESGEFDQITVPSKIFEAILQAMAGPKTDPEKVVLLRQFMPSIGQLLPIVNYLEERLYPVDYPRNRFLENLNIPSEIARLKQRTTVYLVGGNTKPTPVSLKVGASHPDNLVWPDGSILSTTLGMGDGTVQQASLETIDKASLLLDADHGGIVTAAAPFVARTLMGGTIDDSDNLPAEPAAPGHYLLVYAHGDVALHLVAPGGQRIDDTAIDIPGAYYSGSGSSPQLMAIPDPKSDSYQIDVVGSGSYTVGIIDTDKADRNPSITGAISAGDNQHIVYDTAIGDLESGSSVSATTQFPTIINQALPAMVASLLSGKLTSNSLIDARFGASTPTAADQSLPPQFFGSRHHHTRLHAPLGAHLWTLLGIILALLVLIVAVLQYL